MHHTQFTVVKFKNIFIGTACSAKEDRRILEDVTESLARGDVNGQDDLHIPGSGKLHNFGSASPERLVLIPDKRTDEEQKFGPFLGIRSYKVDIPRKFEVDNDVGNETGTSSEYSQEIFSYMCELEASVLLRIVGAFSQCQSRNQVCQMQTTCLNTQR